MIIGNLTVTGLVIIILKLIVLFIAICIASGTEHFKFSKIKQVIRSSCDVACHITTTVGGVIRVLCHGLHHGQQIRRKRRHQAIGNRAGRRSAVAIQGFPLCTGIPTTAVCIAGIPVEITTTGGSGIIHTVTQANGCGSDLANLEVNQVASFLGAVVVEPQNEHIDGQVGKSGIANLTIDHNGLHITNSPIVGTLTGATHFPDGGPTVISQGACGQGDGHRTGLVGRGGIVGSSGNLHRDCGASLCNGGNRYRSTGHAHGGNTGITGSGGNSAIPGPCYRDGVRQFGGGQAHGSLIQRKASSGLSNRPSNRFGSGFAITPFVVCTGREGGVVASSIGSAGGSAKGHFGRIVVAPRRALSRTGIGKGSTLRRNRHRSLSNRPCDAFCVRGAITPLILVLGRKSGRVGSCIGAGGNPAKGHGIGVIAVPRRALGLAVIGQCAALGGNNINGECNTGHSFQGRISGGLGVLCRRHTGSDLLQQVRVGGFILIVGFHRTFSGAFGFIVHFRKLIRRNLAFHQIGFVLLPLLKGLDPICIGLHPGINFIHVSVLHFNIIKFRRKGFDQFIIGCFIRHSSKPRFSTDCGCKRQAVHGSEAQVQHGCYKAEEGSQSCSAEQPYPTGLQHH